VKHRPTPAPGGPRSTLSLCQSRTVVREERRSAAQPPLRVDHSPPIPAKRGLWSARSGEALPNPRSGWTTVHPFPPSTDCGPRRAAKRCPTPAPGGPQSTHSHQARTVVREERRSTAQPLLWVDHSPPIPSNRGLWSARSGKALPAPAPGGPQSTLPLPIADCGPRRAGKSCPTADYGPRGAEKRYPIPALDGPQSTHSHQARTVVREERQSVTSHSGWTTVHPLPPPSAE